MRVRMSESMTGRHLDGSPITWRHLWLWDTRSLRTMRFIQFHVKRLYPYTIEIEINFTITCNDTFGATVLFRRLSILWIPVVIWSVAVALEGMSSCCCCCCCSNLCFNCCCCCCIIFVRCCCNCSCCCCVNWAVVCLTPGCVLNLILGCCWYIGGGW